ncbi:MAG: hypothetical protein D8M57_18935 [Candidatus Scalindua sp. AMX11]|nr:MAG: hypothetical protein DWQ00_08880 [Candidatus Scalindua sp.]NOG84080.1 hypothetical protein [Planctomycetota bacterium]RZV62393.1 MAG: hypothetical protein EX341_18565 [Candidatus Scalindua sp. SCAELEC01]TDE63315.1 MAG: hypothetical protein D8M57_18935 [Candidatus Scalindua sp. AMX11]GJQ57526.1 MAG: hypothetical protein SCALA701_03270 [Candidatus Scalindua sp.]
MRNKISFKAMIATFIVGLIFAVFPYNLKATTILYSSFNELIDNSQHVVEGIVNEIESMPLGRKNQKEDKSRSGNKKSIGTKGRLGDIFTVITLTDAVLIDANGKEKLKEKVKLRIRGGVLDIMDDDGQTVIGEEGVIAEGTPYFEVGEHVILFITNNGIADIPFNGWGQGVFRVDETGQISDSSNNPIIGLAGADLVTKTDEGLMVKGEYIDGTAPTGLKAVEPVLVDSDGGEDSIISSEELLHEDKNGKRQDFRPISAEEFTSIIQERKSLLANQGVNGRKTSDLSRLFVLPDVVSEKPDVERMAVDYDSNGEALNKQLTSDQVNIDTIETLPLGAPEQDEFHERE